MVMLCFRFFLVHDPFPLCQIRLAARYIQLLAYDIRKPLPFQYERQFIDRFNVHIFKNMAAVQIAKQCDFVFDIIR